MRATALALIAAVSLAWSAVPAAAQDAGVPSGPATTAQAQAQTAPATPPTATDGGVATSAAEPDAAAAEEARRRRESREERERWRVPSDLVNPFIDDPRGTDDELGLRARRERGQDDRSWFIVDEEVVDPWRAGEVSALLGVRCRGRLCRADPERAIYLTAPRGRGARRARPRRVELGALVSASTVSSDARVRLEVQVTVRRRSFGLGLTLSTSAGEIRVGASDVTHPRHTLALLLEHRLTDGTIFLDLGAAAGLMLAELEDAEVLPVARVLLTGGIPIVRNVDVLVRADALTTFLRPGDLPTGGPSAFEFGLGVGLRISTP
jgi:hypothetical protein